MLKPQWTNDRFKLEYEGHTVLDGMDVFVRLRDSEGDVRLTRTAAGGSSPSSVVFANEESKVRVEVRLEKTGQGLLVFVDGFVENPSPFGRQTTFAAEDGIVLQFGELPGITGLMANYQHKAWWTRPHFRTDIRSLPPLTTSLLWKTEQSYYYMLPVCGDRLRTDLSGGDGGLRVRVSAYQGGFDRYETLAFVLSAGTDPFALPERNVGLAAETGRVTVRPRTVKRYPDMLDGLGWCSWDAFYQQVNAGGLVEKLSELHGMGLPIRWVMIDDGWSEVDNRKLRSFDADPVKFPQGLVPVVRELKERFGVGSVGVWHTIAGCWGGIDPDSKLFAEYRDFLHEANGGAWIPAPDAAAGFGFWNGWHSYLKRQGIDFVKVDSQSAVLNFLRDQAPVGEAAKAMHTSLEASVALHFDGCVINCMGMASENVWNRPASSLSRNSDDFVPNEPHGFREHALQNAYNSYYHGAFYWGDWDMYWSDHHEGISNMVLRAVSGGPIYVSDKIEGTDPANIWPIVYRDGSIVRCDAPGQPTADCLTVDPSEQPVPLKLWSRSGESGVLALFHVFDGEREVSGTIGLADIPGMEDSEALVYDVFGQRATRLQAGERIGVTLAAKGTAIYSLIPLRHEVEPIGLADKLVPADAVESCSRFGSRTFVRLKEGGTFVFASARKPAKVLANGMEVGFAAAQGADGVYSVDCGSGAGRVEIEIVL